MTGGFDTPQLIGAAFGLIFIVVGLMFVIMPLRFAAQRRSWTPADAVIDRIEKRTSTRSDNTRRWLQADYHYADAQGVLHNGSGRLPAGTSFGPDAAERTMPVLYNPRNPSSSMPAGGGGGMACGIIFGLVFAAIGAGVIWFALTIV